MGKVVKKVGGAVKSVAKSVANPIVGGLGGFALGGPVGAAVGAAGGLAAGSLFGGGGDTKNQQISSTGLTGPGQAQFDFANQQLTGAFGGPTPSVGFDSSGLRSAIGQLQNFAPSGAATGALNRLSGFSGTSSAKNALNQLGAFRGTPEAFRTLRALEGFGQGEQDFVTDARNAVLSFDEGFQSDALPLLQQAAEGQFLTEEGGNPFIRDLINTAQRPVIENFNEQVLPGLLSSFAGTGGVGSSLRGAFTAQQARDLQRNLGDISSTLGFNVFESERAKQLAAQQAILGFEDQGLNRQLAARTTNLGAAQTSANQLLQALQAAGSQATSLSGQRLAALQGKAQGQVSLSAQRQAALAAAAAGQVGLSGQRLAAAQAALGGQQGLAGLNLNASQANAGLSNARIAQLLEFQRNADTAGTTKSQIVRRAI